MNIKVTDRCHIILNNLVDIECKCYNTSQEVHKVQRHVNICPLAVISQSQNNLKDSMNMLQVQTPKYV